jgi:polar amino acid transport system substrate-binding protein
VRSNILNIRVFKKIQLGLWKLVNKLVDKIEDRAFLPTMPNFSSYEMLHGHNVGEIGMRIAKLAGLSNYSDMRLLGLLHDIGKCEIEPKILYKPSSLSPSEFAEIMKHPIYSEELMLLAIADSGVAKKFGNIVRHHHENWDGTGYPDKIKGNNIPVESRILSIADVFDAISSPRIYREYPILNPIAFMEKQAGKKFDKELLLIAKPILKDLDSNGFMNQIVY